MNIPTVLRNRHYRRLFVGMTVSKLGDWFFLIAIPLLVYDMTQSPTQMALVFVVEITPQVLFALIGGALADQISKRKILVFGDFTAAAVVALLPLLQLFGLLELWMVYVAGFLLSSITAFHHPSFESAIPEVLPKEDLLQGNSLFRLMDTIVTFAGPALAGLVIAVFGQTEALWIDALSFVLSGLIIATVRLNGERPVVQRPKILEPIKEGLRYVRQTKTILVGSLLIFGINIGFGAVESLFMYYLKDYLHLSSGQIGLVFSIQALGPLAAVYLAGRLNKVPRGHVMIYSGIAIGIAQVSLIASQTVVAALIICQIVIKGAVTLLAINWFTLRQEIVPGDLLGRVISSTRMIAFLAIPFSGMAAGVLANYSSVVTIFIASGVIVFACSTGAVWSTLYQNRSAIVPK